MNKNLLIVAAVAIIVLIGGGFFLANNQSESTETDTTDSVMQQESEPTVVMEEDSMMEDEDSDAMIEDEESMSDDDAMEEDDSMTGDVREISVEGSEFQFEPSSITVEEGEQIRLTFTNVGDFPHDFVVDELGVQTDTIGPGETDTVQFTADESGTFAFYCSVGNHRAQGMEGDLEVE